MPTTTARRHSCTARTTWSLSYQDASGSPDDAVLDRTFGSEAEALAWADAHVIVPLELEQRVAMFDRNGHLLGTVFHYHEL